MATGRSADKFEWLVDSAGYSESKDKKTFVRRGGKLKPIYPAEVSPPLHVQLLNAYFEACVLIDNVVAQPFLTKALNPIVDQFGLFTVRPESESEDIEKMIRVAEKVYGAFPLQGASPTKVAKEFNAHISPNMSVRFETSARASRLVIEPSTLADWAYVRIASEIDAGVVWERCGHCKSYMLVNANIKREKEFYPLGKVYRKGAEYCSERCRVYSLRGIMTSYAGEKLSTKQMIKAMWSKK